MGPLCSVGNPIDKVRMQPGEYTRAFDGVFLQMQMEDSNNSPPTVFFDDEWSTSVQEPREELVLHLCWGHPVNIILVLSSVSKYISCCLKCGFLLVKAPMFPSKTCKKGKCTKNQLFFGLCLLFHPKECSLFFIYRSFPPKNPISTKFFHTLSA